MKKEIWVVICELVDIIMHQGRMVFPSYFLRSYGFVLAIFEGFGGNLNYLDPKMNG